jgi:hypothetical protein
VVGSVRRLGDPTPHWFWLSDIILHRAALFDADKATLLGTITAGSPGELHYHLFRRPDMKQVLFIWDKTAGPTVDITLPQPATSPFRYDITGRAQRYTAFTNGTLRNVTLKPGEVSIFMLQP